MEGGGWAEEKEGSEEEEEDKEEEEDRGWKSCIRGSGGTPVKVFRAGWKTLIRFLFTSPRFHCLSLVVPCFVSIFCYSTYGDCLLWFLSCLCSLYLEVVMM